MKRFIASFLILLCVLSICTLNVRAEEENKVVRVGYVLAEGYQEGGEGEYKTGFGYEYLQKIKSYTGWEYEYVYGSFSELLQGVANGDVDIMGNISKTPEREEKMLFGEYPQGNETYHLNVTADNTEIKREDLSTICGKKVGVNAGSIQVGMFENWMARNDITDVELVEYSSSKERAEALNNGEIDMLITAQVPSDQTWIDVCSIGESAFYFVCNPQKPWIKKELDKAQADILYINPNYNANLFDKYHYDSNVTRTTLTLQEKNWVSEHPVINVGYLDDALPYCATDKKGEMTGMFREYFDEIGSIYSLQFNFIAYDNFSEILNALKAEEVDVAVPMYYDYWTAENLDVALIDELVTSSVSIISMEDYDKQKYDRIAVANQYFFQPYYIYSRYPDAEYIECKNLQDCIDKVSSGEADCTFYNSDLLQVKMADYTDLLSLQVRNLRTDNPVSMATRVGEKELVSILNKGVANSSESHLSSLMVIYAHQAGSNDVSFIKYIKAHAFKILIVTAVGLSVIIIGLILINNKALKQKRNLKDALDNYQKADAARRTDFLTGLYNRQEMFEVLQRAVSGDIKSIQAVYLLDIDNFKMMNDNYGHERGDECLKIIGNGLRQFCAENDMIPFRYGGEELMCISFVGGKDPDIIAEKLVRLVADLRITRKDVPTGYITVSLGYTTQNSRYEKMINMADQALYYSKKNGKNQANCYEKIEDKLKNIE